MNLTQKRKNTNALAGVRKKNYRKSEFHRIQMSPRQRKMKIMVFLIEVKWKDEPCDLAN